MDTHMTLTLFSPGNFLKLSDAGRGPQISAGIVKYWICGHS